MNIYDLATLLGVVNTFKVPQPFWLGFFPNVLTSQTDKIYFDAVNADYRRLAPFVAPNVQGKVLTNSGYTTNEFKPAYIKIKHIVDSEMVFVRRAGEPIGTGSMSPQERRDASIADILYRHTQMLIMRNEWMASKAVIDGKVTIGDEDDSQYPLVTVDYGRDASLTSVLTGNARWTDLTNSDPLGDLTDMRNNVKTLTGEVVRQVIMGQDALALFLARDEIKDLLNTEIRGSETNLSRWNDNLDDSLEYIGSLVGANGNGRMEIWSYSGKYRDPDTDALTDILSSYDVVGVAPGYEGYQCYGAIKDPQAGYQALQSFPRMWMSNDPCVEYIMTQSAPLMVPSNVNKSFKITVGSAS